MRQLQFIRKEKLEWREVADPVIENALEAVVRPFAVAKCDLDDAFLFNNLPLKLKIGKRLGLVDSDFFKHFGKNFFKGPFAFGHECVAEVVETGDKVSNLKTGDVVSVPFQISCGACIHCSAGITSACENTPPISTYGFGKHLAFGGAMSDKLKVPFADSMLLKIPGHLNPVHLASLSDNVPDAYRNVGSDLEQHPDKSILIISGKARSVALYTILISKALGAAQVDYADNDTERLAIAKKAGADNLFTSLEDIKNKYDVVVDASSTQKGVSTAVRCVKPYGVVSSSGIYIKKVHMPLIEMYAKGVVFRTGLANTRTDAAKVLDLIARNKLNLDLVTTKLDSWNNAADAFLSRTAKVIVTRERMHNAA